MNIKIFTSSSGIEIWVGMDDRSNDRLSLKEAHPNDYWFHVNGFPGSHVLLRCGESGIEPDKESIKEAAQLAAYFSKMRNAGTVSVHYCRAKDVQKPRKARPGTVSIRRAKKLNVKPELLDSENRGL